MAAPRAAPRVPPMAKKLLFLLVVAALGGLAFKKLRAV
jgi:hypothetical protein